VVRVPRATIDEVTRDPARLVLPAVGVLMVGAVAWFAASGHDAHGPAVVGWVPGPLGLLITAAWTHHVAGTAGLPGPARQFWRGVSGVAALCALGVVVQGFQVLRSGGTGPKLPNEAALIYLAAMLGAVWTLLRVPVRARTTGEWVRLWLDAVTVLLGAALFMWYVAFAPILAAHDGLAFVWASLTIGGVCLVGLAGVVKIALAGSGVVDAGAVRLLGLALLGGGVTSGVATFLAGKHIFPGHVSVPVICWLVVLAAERQRQAVGRPDPQPATRQRQYSLLPYLAVAATDVLLLLVTIGPGDQRRPVVVAGAITITALVVVRQLAAFIDNARLVDQLRQSEDRLRHQASHDELTRLANRTLFGEQVDAALGDSASYGRLAVLIVDLDDFKTVNDTLGHAVGDALLATVAQRIRHCVRPEDAVARLGGDEFAILLRHAHSDTIDAVAERVLASLGRPLAVHGDQMFVQASIGVAVARPGDDTGTLLRNADIAMYAAKESGKGGFARYESGMAAHIQEQAKLGAHLRQALDDGHLHLVYQPIVRLADRQVIGMETLVRWRHPLRGPVPPVKFIPAAERTGLIVPLGRWVLHQACHQQALWRKAYGDAAPASVSVNVSGRQLQEPDFVDQVADAVHEAGLTPQELVLEVTETAVLTGRQVHEALQALHGFGVRLALDDFGTGQSSLGLIQTCPVDVLKLDRSFVDGITSGEQRSAVAAAVAQIARALGLQAVAEGIESQEQADRLWKLGYRLGQGFHLVPPLPAEALAEILSPAAVRP
jgi:diguanylate cyclase